MLDSVNSFLASIFRFNQLSARSLRVYLTSYSPISIPPSGIWAMCFKRVASSTSCAFSRVTRSSVFPNSSVVLSKTAKSSVSERFTGVKFVSD